MGIRKLAAKLVRSIALLAIVLWGALAPPAAAQGIFDESIFDSDLIKAIRAGDNDALDAALFAESPNERSSARVPAIVVAAEYRNLYAVQTLVEAGARIDNRDRGDRTALTVAAGMGETAVVRTLLELGADVDRTGSARETALLKAARDGHAEVIQVLIEADSDIFATDLTGSTALEIAERNRHRRAAEVLREAGAY